jgi:mRNA interferase YafQ
MGSETMRTLERTTRFKRDYRREKKTDPALDDALLPLLDLLLSDAELPERLSDHPLSGEWKGFRDCHVRPDLLLIYAKAKGVLRLVRLGSHSELF